MYAMPQTKKRLMAIAFLVCFMVVSLLTEVFMFSHANHTHEHNGADGTCATCDYIQSTENLLKQLGTAATGVFFSLASLFAACTIVNAICSNITTLTPITLKIRMNN